MKQFPATFFCFVFAAAAAFVTFAASAASVNAQESAFSVDFTQKGAPVRAVNGTNLGAKLSGTRIFDTQPLVTKLHFSTVRLHDVPLDNPGMRLVDVPQIFGNLKADPSDPDSYYFDATDDYIRRIIESGSKIIYRLGTSIEHTEPNRYFAKEPQDYEHFAAICEGIIRHYNEGWGNGFKYNIEYWEIWNEPNLNPQMWDKDFTTYCTMYVKVAKYLKARFPNLKIGGPALTHAGEELIREFCETCKREGAPIDFFSWHCYAATPSAVLDPPKRVREILDSYGFTKTELHLNEWHYFPCSWSEIHGTEGGPDRKAYWRTCPEGMNGIDAAAFCGYVLTRWQDTPLDMSNYYATNLTNWGLFSIDGLIQKPYYTFLVFGDLMQTQPVRVKTTDVPNVSLLGTVGEKGEKRLFVSNWKQNVEELTIRLEGVPASGTVTVSRVDGDQNAAEETLSYSDGVLKIQNKPGSWVLGVKFQ